MTAFHFILFVVVSFSCTIMMTKGRAMRMLAKAKDETLADMKKARLTAARLTRHMFRAKHRKATKAGLSPKDSQIDRQISRVRAVLFFCLSFVCFQYLIHCGMCYPSYSRRWLWIWRWGPSGWVTNRQTAWPGSRQRFCSSRWSSHGYAIQIYQVSENEKRIASTLK